MAKPAPDLEAFLRERGEALRSLEKARIDAYAKRYGIRLPANPEAYWGGIHKARLALKALSAEEKRVSREWLNAHGFRTDGWET